MLTLAISDILMSQKYPAVLPLTVLKRINLTVLKRINIAETDYLIWLTSAIGNHLRLNYPRQRSQNFYIHTGDSTQTRLFPSSTYAPTILKQSAIMHTKLPPTTTSIMQLMLLDESEVGWPTWANGRTATESGGDLPQQDSASPRGPTEAGQTGGRTHTVISDSLLGVIWPASARQSQIPRRTDDSLSWHTNAHTQINTRACVIYFILARGLSLISQGLSLDPH